MDKLGKISAELKKAGRKTQAANLQRFFKTGKGQYGEGDVFLGIKVPVTRKIALQYIDLDFPAISKLLASEYHEFRLAALLILVAKYQGAENQKIKEKIVKFYLRHTKRINNWDLVDLSAPKILGDYFYLVAQKDEILHKLARSKNLWERRIAMLSTFAFIQKGRADESLVIAKQLLSDEHDLMHKAVGWMLREVGKRVSKKKLTTFLDKEIKNIPRTALRYAIEHFSPAEREHYLKQ
ncbi:MAG: DNA alkylation repair protein [Patescibacteria group bacterium]